MATSLEADIRQRRTMATSSNNTSSDHSHQHTHDPTHTRSHDHDHEHDHSHSHSHGIFGHTHTQEGPSEQAEEVMKVLQGSGDAGSRITVIGLISNVGLTAAKGIAGWTMNSAALLADAGHSFSDLIGDIVTLICWKLSRKPPSEAYPFGYAKFETLGTVTISALLVLGAFGIGAHALHLLLHALETPVSTLPEDSIIASAYHTITHLASSLPLGHSHGGHSHSHSHGSGGVLDPNAAWFAGGSIIAKEWLYRATARVAEQENSPVLQANALHHRSDAYSSAVALLAIGGSVYFPHVPLDPIGGLVVSLLILKQGWGLCRGAFGEVMDAGVPEATRTKWVNSLQALMGQGGEGPSIQAITDFKARRAGAKTFVQLTARVDPGLRVADTMELERRVVEILSKARGEIDVRVRFIARSPRDDVGK